MIRALVIGASGQVGSALSAHLRQCGHEVTGTHARVSQPGTRALDFTDTAATRRLIAEVAPDWVFCPAGLTHVDYCEQHPDDAMSANRDAPAAAARAAAAHGAGFVFYSTDYVFDGAHGPYSEDDPVNPVSAYGRSKLEGERRVLEEVRALVIRTTVVYGPEPQEKNFVYQLLRRARSGERMTVPNDQVSSPTYNADLAAASVELSTRGRDGIYHVAGPGLLDRYAFARLACEVFGVGAHFLAPVSTGALRQIALRPLSAGLRTDKARGVLATSLRGPREGLTAMREALARGPSSAE